MAQVINIHIGGANGGSGGEDEMQANIVSSDEGPSPEGLSMHEERSSQAPSPEMAESLSADFAQGPPPEDMDGNNAFSPEGQDIGLAPSPEFDMQESSDMAPAPEPQDDQLADLIEKPAESKKVKISRAKK